MRARGFAKNALYGAIKSGVIGGGNSTQPRIHTDGRGFKLSTVKKTRAIERRTILAPDSGARLTTRPIQSFSSSKFLLICLAVTDCYTPPLKSLRIGSQKETK